MDYRESLNLDHFSNIWTVWVVIETPKITTFELYMSSSYECYYVLWYLLVNKEWLKFLVIVLDIFRIKGEHQSCSELTSRYFRSNIWDGKIHFFLFYFVLFIFLFINVYIYLYMYLSIYVFIYLFI